MGPGSGKRGSVAQFGAGVVPPRAVGRTPVTVTRGIQPVRPIGVLTFRYPSWEPMISTSSPRSRRASIGSNSSGRAAIRTPWYETKTRSMPFAGGLANALGATATDATAASAGAGGAAGDLLAGFLLRDRFEGAASLTAIAGATWGATLTGGGTVGGGATGPGDSRTNVASDGESSRGRRRMRNRNRKMPAVVVPSQAKTGTLSGTEPNGSEGPPRLLSPLPPPVVPAPVPPVLADPVGCAPGPPASAVVIVPEAVGEGVDWAVGGAGVAGTAVGALVGATGAGVTTTVVFWVALAVGRGVGFGVGLGVGCGVG